MNASPEWTRERVDLIKRSICPKGISDDEFALFIEQCKRAGLDPLLKQAFCVARRQNIGTKDKPQWVTKHEFQPAEAGMLARAEQFPGYQGVTGAAVYSEDPITIDFGSGVVEHRVNPAQRKGTLVGAWSRVQREGKTPVVTWVDFSAVNQPTPLWGKMPAVMTLKCARVAGLRATYPEAFGGLYVAGERPDDMDTGEEAEVIVAPVERPALPPPAPRETLTASPKREPVPRMTLEQAMDAPSGSFPRGEVVITDLPPREPGSDDAETEPDPMTAEILDIVNRSEAAQSHAELEPLKARALRFSVGTKERKTLSAALTAAWGRITQAKKEGEA